MRCSAAILAAAILAAIPSGAADTYRVAGVLVNALTGDPIPRTRMLLLRGNDGKAAGSQLTGEDGRFAFDPPQGTYRLLCLAQEAEQFFGAKHLGSTLASAIITGPGKDTADLVFRWFPPAAISGTVRDENGDPVESAVVQLVRSAVSGGRRTTTALESTRTNDRGEYRFGLLPGGSYYLVVRGEPWYNKRTSYMGRAGVPAAYQPQYYPNAADGSQAAPLVLRPAEEARADFVLPTVPGAKITIKLKGPAGLRGTLSLLSDGIPGIESYQYHGQFTEPEVRIEGAPPGRYTARAVTSSGGVNLAGFQTVDVLGADVAVELSLLPPTSVSGTVRMAAPDRKLPAPLSVGLIRSDHAVGGLVRVQPDGSFLLPAVAPGRWRPVLRGNGVFASDFRVEGAEMRDGAIEVMEGQSITLTVTASDQTGRVKGSVVRNGRPTEGVLVVLAEEPFSGDPLSTFGFQTDSDGTFAFGGVKAGNYLLFTADSDAEYLNAKETARYLPGAKRIRVEPNSVYEETITLTESPDASAPRSAPGR